MRAVVSSAAEAKRKMKLGTAIIDVDFGLTPKVRLSFLKSNDETECAAARV
jgi:hypothetical protein